MSRKTGFIGVILIAAVALAALADANEAVKADKVLVVKSERKLYLLRNGKILKSYTVSLGLQPRGPKLQKGDKKTPEGIYILDRRNPKSKYFKSIHISYPNQQDRQQAAQRGVDPGGEIAIHGLPTYSKEEAWDYIERDWTDGCIAVTNDEMQEIWDLVEDHTPIEIIP
jgi:murein L,D-transpeptidase YafK